MSLISIKLKKRKIKSFFEIDKKFRYMPNFKEDKEYIFFEINNEEEFWRNQTEIYIIYESVRNWKNVTILIFDKENPNYRIFFRELESFVREKYSFLPSLLFTIEDDLPFNYVFYEYWACFFVFMDKLDHSKYYLCECQKEAVLNSIKLGSNMKINLPNFVYNDFSKCSNSLEFFDDKFKKNLCFKCNNISPTIDFCSYMYANTFIQNYGWYVYSYAYENKIDMWKEIEPELKNKLENEVRKKFDYAKKGEKWISETKMYHLIKEIFPEEEVIFHYRSEWLNRLEIDVYLPKLKLGFEYQGKQHFEAIDFFGGKESFEKQKQRDLEKEVLCENNKVKIIKINYYDSLNKRFIQSLIDEYLE